MHELVVTLPDKHTKHYLHLRLFYIRLFKLACFLDPIMSIYFIPESPTKGFELSTLAHQLSPFMYINVHSAMSVNPSSGFEWTKGQNECGKIAQEVAFHIKGQCVPALL